MPRLRPALLSLALPLLAATAAAQPAAPGAPAPAPAAAAQASLAGVAQWVGCLPTCRGSTPRRGGEGLRPPQERIFEHPPLRNELNRLLGRDEVRVLLQAQAEQPVERDGDWVRLAVCRAQACETDIWHLFVNIAENSVLVCRSLKVVEADGRVEERGAFYRSGQGRRALPPGGCDRQPPQGSDWGLLGRLLRG